MTPTLAAPLDDLLQHEALLAHKRLRHLLCAREHRIRDDDAQHYPSVGRAVLIAGVRYKSANQARIALKCNITKIHAMIEIGEARYA